MWRLPVNFWPEQNSEPTPTSQWQPTSFSRYAPRSFLLPSSIVSSECYGIESQPFLELYLGNAPKTRSLATLPAPKQVKRQSKVERHALAQFTHRPDAAAVRLHNVLDDRQTKPVPPASRERALSTR